MFEDHLTGNSRPESRISGRTRFKIMRTLATLGLLATAVLSTSPAPAADVPSPAAQDAAKDVADMEVYGTLLPFFEYVGTFGATPQGTTSPAPNLIGNASITGLNHDPRFRMTSGTSHFGFRGDLPIAGDVFKLIWQVESPTPIDGEGPNMWAARNSHVGFTGVWGTFIYGNWDTPMKWVTTTSVNPIKGGYVADMIPIIGSAGAQTPALNSDPTLVAAWELIPNRAGFFRHEVNTVQYWSPTIAGFSARLMFGANEHRLAGTTSEPAVNPYLFSGYIGWDNSWLRLRYAAELHNDYFGLGNLGGQPDGQNSPHSRDIGHLGLASVTLNGSTDYKTRIVVTGDYLTYHTDDTTPNGVGLVTELSRMAVYGLVQQSFGSHNVWVAGGHATEGTCGLRGFDSCPTTGLSADYGTLGYLYSFTKDSGVYLIGYGLWNDIVARYSPFPILDSQKASSTTRGTTFSFLPNIGEIAAGADTLGVGLGFVHTFNVGIFGQTAQAPAKPTQPVPVPEPKKAQPPTRETEADAGPDKGPTPEASPAAAEEEEETTPPAP
jgi:predicted porin